MIAQMLVLVALPALLAIAAGWDLASYTIPNFLQLFLLAAFVLFAISAGLSPAQWGDHLLAGGIGLLAGFTFFALGYIGGGDAKLFACAALWFGLHDLPVYALSAALFGGALTLAILAGRQLVLPAVFARQSWLLRLHDSKEGIPYGAALALGAFVIIPQAEIFRLAAGG